MDGQPTWTDCDEAGDYVVPNVLSPRDLVFRPDNMNETVPRRDRGNPALVKKQEIFHQSCKSGKPVCMLAKFIRFASLEGNIVCI